jgi:hypothetical protein
MSSEIDSMWLEMQEKENITRKEYALRYSRANSKSKVESLTSLKNNDSIPKPSLSKKIGKNKKLVSESTKEISVAISQINEPAQHFIEYKSEVDIMSKLSKYLQLCTSDDCSSRFNGLQDCYKFLFENKHVKLFSKYFRTHQKNVEKCPWKLSISFC